MVREMLGVRTVTKTLKARWYGWIVDTSTVYNSHGKIDKWWELIDPDDPDGRIEIAFRSRVAAMEWAKSHVPIADKVAEMKWLAAHEKELKGVLK